jgi:hypothetical protein
LVAVVDALPAVEPEGEGECVGDVVSSGGAEWYIVGEADE